MNEADQNFADRISNALGSSRVVDLPCLPSGGPLDLLHLRSMVAELHQGSAAVDCKLQVSAESWRELEALAAELRAEGEEVTPTILARLLLERGVEALRESRQKTG